MTLDKTRREPIAFVHSDSPAPHILYTCEHAGNELFAELPGGALLGLDDDVYLFDHFGWDPGAWKLTQALAKAHDCPAVGALFSRLLCDPNRPPAASSWIVKKCDDHVLTFNQKVSKKEEQRRQKSFYDPYHQAMHALIEKHSPNVLVSVHSFTPVFSGQKRDVEIGVLYDDHAERSEALTEVFKGAGFDARNNEPYSGREGLMYAVQEAGRKYNIPHVELEIRNDLLSDEKSFARVKSVLEKALPNF